MLLIGQGGGWREELDWAATIVRGIWRIVRGISALADAIDENENPHDGSTK